MLIVINMVYGSVMSIKNMNLKVHIFYINNLKYVNKFRKCDNFNVN